MSDSKIIPTHSVPAPILKPVFIPAAGLIALVVVLTALSPELAGGIFTSINSWIVETVGWFYALSVSVILVTCLFLAFSSLGQIRLGPDHSTPDYSYISWFAMLFSAGMGIGLLFFGVAEPIMHYAAPPEGAPETWQSARAAMEITYFHWGLHAWAIYVVVGMSLAYFSFRCGLPLTIRSALYPIIGDRIYGPIGHAVDVFAVIGTLFGVATSLGLGVSQVNAGLAYLFGLPTGTSVQITLIALITGAATISVVSGLDKGIKRLSELNMLLACVLLVCVIAAGPTLLIFNSYVENLGNYLQTMFQRSLDLKVYEEGDAWLGDWTIFYWGWWVSWSPFVGMFIARISRGRTIREFVLGVLLVPSLVSFLWFTAFGNSALFLELAGDGAGIAVAVSENMPVALFKFLENLPFAEITSLMAIVLVVTFFVTSSDSGSLVIDIITVGGKTNTAVWQRVFWAVSEGLVAAILLLAGGLGALQTATVASALPFTVVVLFATFGLVRALRAEMAKLHDGEIVPDVAVSGASDIPWRTRLNAILSHPTKARVEKFIDERVVPALQDVAGEIQAHDSSAHAVVDTDTAELVVAHQDEPNFHFAVKPKGCLKPAFAFPEFNPDDERGERFYRAVVHLADGGQEYCIFGYTQEQIINDVLKQYHRHIHHLHMARA